MSKFLKVAGLVLVTLAVIALAVFIVVPTNSYAASKTDYLKQQQLQMFDPSVIIRAGGMTGSGTVIYSRLTEDGARETYILTNEHVVTTVLGKSPFVDVYYPRYNHDSEIIGSDIRTGKVVKYDASRDLALVKILDEENGPSAIATLAPEDTELFRGQEVFMIGSGLGNPPYVTVGNLGYTGRIIDGYPYLMSTAQIIGGNSGGSLYYQDETGKFLMIGVPSKVSASEGMPVSHISLSIELSSIYSFLRSSPIKDSFKAPETASE